LEFHKRLIDGLTQLDAGWRNEAGFPSIPMLSRGSLRAKIYAPRGHDPQTPHTQDEVYIVVRGHGEFICGEHRSRFLTGDLLFVPAGINHRFESFSDELSVWVIFYGPEGGEQPESGLHKNAPAQ
jgi:mannose-6-phosphate isomerase-like protein (cupin superfamily)